jgi:hypothetical protein
MWSLMPWARAVGRGEAVEIPGGILQAKIMNGKPRRKFQRFRNVRTGTITYKFIHYRGRRRVVNFRPDECLDLTPLPVPPPPPTADEIECRHLAAELLARAVDDPIMAELQKGADFPHPKAGALFRRLREVRNRGWRISGTEDLATALAKLYWL